MRDTRGLDRAPPGSPGKRRGPQSLTATAAPRQERRETLPFALPNPTPPSEGRQSGTDTGLTHSPRDAVIAVYECGPQVPFQMVTLTLIGVPDDGRRRQLVFDLLWGRWSRPPEADGAAVPAPPRPPTLTGGAAVEVETPAMAA